MMRRLIAGTSIAFVAIGLGYPAIAAADPKCPANAVRIQGEVVPAPANQMCDNDPVDNDGLLGGLPVAGNLPGVSGVL
jgi:hypothetical protein